MTSKITTHTSVWIAQDTMESRLISQILAHRFSHGTLDSVMALLILKQSTHLYACVLLLILIVIPNYLHNILECFCNLFICCISYNCVFESHEL